MNITKVPHIKATRFGGHCFELSAPANVFDAELASYFRDYAPEAYATSLVEYPRPQSDGTIAVIVHRFGSAD